MDKRVKSILKRLNDKGYEAFVVGGYPRDCYLRRKTNDYDICTNAKPNMLEKIFPELKKIGVCSYQITYDEINMEVTSYRKELEYENHRFLKRFEYAKTLREDLERRDFVINTLCINYHENEIDFFDAKKDIDNKIIRTVGNPFKRLDEDALRILRAIRFATILDFQLEKNLIEAIKEKKYLLKELSYERKLDELRAIFSRSKGIELLQELECASDLELGDLSRVVWDEDVDFIFAQLSMKQYPWNKKERKKIQEIQELLNADFNDEMVLYHMTESWLRKICRIRNFDWNSYREKKRALPIQNEDDIIWKESEAREYFSEISPEIIRKLYKTIEISIVKGKIENKKDVIKDWIKKEISLASNIK